MPIIDCPTCQGEGTVSNGHICKTCKSYGTIIIDGPIIEKRYMENNKNILESEKKK